MKDKKINKKGILTGLIIMVLMVSLTSCSTVSDWFSVTKGTLIGNEYTIYQYDNNGNKTLELYGSHIDIEPYQPEEKEDGTLDLNSVLDITIDGSQILTVGNTLIFEEKGVDKIAGFEEIENFTEIYSDSLVRFIPFDKLINEFKDFMGKSRVILVYSQLGEPIGIYQGNSIKVTIPKDLPKMTRINIDGKSLYLHRVNYTIIDTDLL